MAGAWIVLRDPSAEPDAQVFIDHCSNRLARFKVPRHIFYVRPEELPLTATGRVQKFRLTEAAVRLLGSREVPV